MQSLYKKNSSSSSYPDMEQQLQTATTKILRPTQDAYFQAHAGWWDTGLPPTHWQPLVYKYPQLTVIGAAHSNTVDSPILNQIKTHLANFLGDPTIPQNKKLVMVEGYVDHMPHYQNEDQAIQYMGESGLGNYLASQAGVTVVSPEVESDPRGASQLITKLLAQFSPEQCTVFAVLDSITSLIRKNEMTSHRFASIVVHYAKLYHAHWQNHTPNQTNQILTEFQYIMQNYLNQPFWRLHGQNIELLVDEQFITRLTDNTVFLDADHPYAGWLNDISRVEDAARDDYLVFNLYHAYQQHKYTFIIFGGSHILAIKPALDYLFNE